MNLIEATNYFLNEEESTNPFNLGNNMEVVPQKNSTGKSVPFTWHDDRVILRIKAQGKMLDIYQSANGTSGKTIGAWYPYGWIIDDNKTGFSWFVKGSNLDSGYGIPSLGSVMDQLNSVLPHSDDDTLEFLKSISDDGLPYGWGDATGPEHWAKTYNLDEVLSDNDIYKKIKKNQVSLENNGTKESIYYILSKQWMEQLIYPVWGK